MNLNELSTLSSETIGHPALQQLAEALQRQAELTAQDILRAKQELEIKEQELLELRRKNNIEEQRAADLLRISTKVDQLYALIIQYLDSYVQHHHEPITDSLSAIKSRIDSILQSLLYVIPAVLQNNKDEKLSKLQDQLHYFMNNPQATEVHGTTVVIDNSSKLSNFRTKTGDIRDFAVKE